MLFSAESGKELEVVNPVPVIQLKSNRFEQLAHLGSQSKDDTRQQSDDLKTMQNEIEEIIGPDQARNFNIGQQPLSDTGDSPLRRVLVVDDCPFNIVSLQCLFEQFNISCDFGINGEDALQKVSSRLK